MGNKEELTDAELEKILKKLLGECYPAGDEAIDEKRYNNLLNWNSVLNIAFDEISECSQFRNDNRYSMNKIGTMASEILKGVRKDIDIALEDELESDIIENEDGTIDVYID